MTTTITTRSASCVIESGHLPHTTNPAAVAAELISLANSAFDSDSRASDTPHGPTAGKEQ
jgi:hypothetical protein